MLQSTSSVRTAAKYACTRSDSIVDHVIGPNGLLASKARVVVTNSIHFLKHFKQVLYIRRGVILESGTYAELVSNSQCELHKLV